MSIFDSFLTTFTEKHIFGIPGARKVGNVIITIKDKEATIKFFDMFKSYTITIKPEDIELTEHYYRSAGKAAAGAII